MSLLFRFLDSENTEFRFNMVIYSTKIPYLPNIDRKIYFENMKLRIDFKTKKMLNIFSLIISLVQRLFQIKQKSI